MKDFIKKSIAIMTSAVMLSTSAMAANYWTDEVQVEAGKGSATIDGVFNTKEWATAKEIPITLNNDKIVSKFGVYQGGWADSRNASDFSASMYFMWDDKALYICEVRRDDYVELDGTGSAPFLLGDGNLIFLQTIDGGEKGNENAWSHHIFYIVGNGNGEYGGDAYVRVNNGSNKNQEMKKYDEIKIASAPVDGGFCVELMVPWSVFAKEIPSFVPADGVQIGMSMVPIDFDEDEGLSQLCWVNQSTQLNVPGGYDFGGWATMTLAAAPASTTSPRTADTVSLAVMALASSLAAGFIVLKSRKHGN